MGIFAAAHCDRVDFRCRVAKDIFDWQRFASFFDIKDEEEPQSRVAHCRTLEPDSLDYHIHFRWSAMKEEYMLYVSFHAGALKESEGEREPYAERFMSWLGGFFSNETAHADIHTEFVYESDSRRSRFPLPIKFPMFEGMDAEIRGLNLVFPSEPDGISGANLSLGKKSLSVNGVGTTRIQFSTFDIKQEVERLSVFSLKLTEEID